VLVRKLWAVFWGYVTIRVEGQMLERFLNLALARNIYFWDVNHRGKNKLKMKVTAGGFKPLRHIARTTGSRVHIEAKHGLPFLWFRTKKRKMLAVGLLVFLVGIYFFSSFIWFVEVTSEEELKYLTTADIERQLAEMGLRPGVGKWTVDLRRIEEELMGRLPKLSWVGVTVQGTKAHVEVVEKTLPPDNKAEKTPAHVVAGKDGIIEEVLVIAGESKVQPGDAVFRGQILISGVIFPQTADAETGDRQGDREQMEGPRKVHARGIVKARVWYQGRAEVKLLERGERRTGNKTGRTSIKLGGKEIIIRGPKNSPYQYFQSEEKVKTIPSWRNLNLPVELVTTTYYEVEKYQIRRNKEEAAKIAARRAAESIRQRISSRAKIVDKRTGVVISRGKVSALVTWEILEDIAETKLLD